MKISEIIVEGRANGKLRKSSINALPNLTTYDSLDNNNNPYDAYRYGVALAGSPRTDMDKHGPIGTKFTMIDYSEAEAEIRKGADRIMGVKPSKSTGRGSIELDSVNKKSVLPKIKKNKFGV